MKRKFINNTKASETYVEVNFDYGKDCKRNWYVPIKNRRDGTNLEDASEKEIEAYLKKVEEKCHPKNWDNWKKEQENFWKNRNAKITKPIFDALVKDFSWVPVYRFSNPNYARRIQDLKEFGYTIASGVKKYDNLKKNKIVHVLLLPLPRGGISGYEQWDKQTRNRIVIALKKYDAYEGKSSKPHGLLPDHKFPEVRWDQNTKRTQEEISKLSTKDIKRDFQLISNQRNLQKREICRNCFQTNIRGTMFGIDYFYKGVKEWDEKISKTGKTAENGCVGCGWYDIEEWRKNLNQNIKEKS